jgi:hypothetical protein
MSERRDYAADPAWWRKYMSQSVRDSPLYTQIYTYLPHDQEVRELLTFVDQAQPVPPLFCSAVNFVLQNDVQHPLAAFYPYFNPNPRPVEEVYPVFHDFCLKHQERLRQILPTLRMQTNEVTRCANLLPVFEMVFQRGTRKPLALVEIGTSAGLNLNWSKYGYDYGQGRLAGDVASPVQLHCTLQGEYLPPLPEIMPPVASCLGIDIAPLDILNEDHVRWLRACFFPEELQSFRALDAAIDFARQHPPTILTGDARALLPEMLEAIPSDQTICLWHSYMLRQCPPEVSEDIEQLIMEYAQKRDLYRISLEFLPHERWSLPRLELFTYEGGNIREEWLAMCRVHGDQMEWLRPEAHQVLV